MATQQSNYGTGRRKTATARVYMKPGTGKITVNDRSLDEFFGRETGRMIVRQPPPERPPGAGPPQGGNPHLPPEVPRRDDLIPGLTAHQPGHQPGTATTTPPPPEADPTAGRISRKICAAPGAPGALCARPRIEKPSRASSGFAREWLYSEASALVARQAQLEQARSTVRWYQASARHFELRIERHFTRKCWCRRRNWHGSCSAGGDLEGGILMALQFGRLDTTLHSPLFDPNLRSELLRRITEPEVEGCHTAATHVPRHSSGPATSGRTLEVIVP